MAKDTAFPFFFNWRKPFEMLSGDECKALLIAMLDYVEHGTEPPAFTERAEMAAAFVFPALDRSREIKESRSRAGKIGNETRWKAAADEHKSVANDRTTSQNIANDCTASLKEKRREENKRKDAPPYPPTGGQGESARDELFEKFWMEYPKKAKRTEAEEAWKALAPDDALLERMLGTIRAQCASSDWQREGGRYIPLASNWLRDCRWEDVPPSRFSGYPVTYEEIESL